MADPELKKQVEEMIASNEVLLFMKGVPEQPRCGFSMRTVQVLESLGIEYGAIDVLQALEPLREITGEISDWQTFPQLYVKGELVGGCDIVEELHATGELATLVGASPGTNGNPAAEVKSSDSAEPYQSPPIDIDPPR